MTALMRDQLWLLLRERFKSWSGNLLSLTSADSALEALTQQAARRNMPPVRYLDWLEQRPAEQQGFVERLLIRTTWFMREPDAILALANAFRRRAASRGDSRPDIRLDKWSDSRPDIRLDKWSDSRPDIRLDHMRPAGQRVTIWSVACASGEEPYSLAMTFLEAGLDPTVLATDLSAEARTIGEEGEYPAERLEELPARLRQRFFVPTSGGRYRVSQALRNAVTFVEHNLARSTRPPAGWASFDVIVCRNVLLYFERDQAQRILGELAGYCRGDGYVLLSAAEHPLAWAVPDLIWQRSDDIPLLRRRRGGQDDLPPLPERTPTPLPILAPPAVIAGAASGDLRGWVAAAQAALRSGHAETAANLARGLVAEHPLYGPAHLVLGLLHKAAGRMTEAAASLRKARFLFGDDSWLAPYTLAVCLESTGEKAEALEAYKHARAILQDGGASGWPDPEDNEPLLAGTALESCRQRIASLGPP